MIVKHPCCKILTIAFSILLMSAIGTLSTFASTYEVDYSVISSGGGEASSTSYEMESIVTTTGVDAQPQSSSTYAVDSPMAEAEPPAAVEDWMLH
jgi:hypothetical protein